MTGRPKDKEELAVGDIRKYYAVFGLESNVRY